MVFWGSHLVKGFIKRGTRNRHDKYKARATKDAKYEIGETELSV